MNDKLVTIILSLTSAAIALATFFIGRASAHRAAGEKEGYLASDIGYIKAGIDDLKTEIRALKAEVTDILDRLARAEEKIEHAHKRIDDIMEMLNKG